MLDVDKAGPELAAIEFESEPTEDERAAAREIAVRTLREPGRDE